MIWILMIGCYVRTEFYPHKGRFDTDHTYDFVQVYMHADTQTYPTIDKCLEARGKRKDEIRNGCPVFCIQGYESAPDPGIDPGFYQPIPIPSSGVVATPARITK